MLSRHTVRSKIPLARPLRPPNVTKRAIPQPRLFTQNTQLLLLNQRAGSRPQLPYLAQPISRVNGGFLGPNPQLARLISTEYRRYASEQFFLAAKWTVLLWVFGILGGMIYLGVAIELQERQQPTPSEWRFWTRWSLRNARAQMKAGEEAQGFIDWAAVGSSLRRCLAALDDQTKDGKGVREVVDGGIVIEGVGKAGLDISGKSWPWRAGYYEALMGCAAAAEHLDSMVLDNTRSLVFPQEVMIGPSNPDPRPVPVYMHAAPKEEDCVPAFDAPETYYMRILTSQGFTTRQKLDAALSYANWLEFKGLHDSAGELYRWAVDIATSGLPSTVLRDEVIDAKTAVLKVTGSTTEATPNLLRATTALAIHHGRTGNVSSALPILLSVLRARRAAPVSQDVTFTRKSKEAKTDIAAATNFVQKIFSTPQYPAPPPSGDEPLVRTSEKPTCEESELMLYIGEILFATSSSSSEGVGWTRQAVTIAEANLQGGSDAAERAKCKACLATGVGNWETMLKQLASQQSSIVSREGGRAPGSGMLEWRGWFGRDGVQKGKTLDELQSGIVEKELKQVERLKERIVRDDVGQQMETVRPSGGTGVWIGG